MLTTNETFWVALYIDLLTTEAVNKYFLNSARITSNFYTHHSTERKNITCKSSSTCLQKSQGQFALKRKN